MRLDIKKSHEVIALQNKKILKPFILSTYKKNEGKAKCIKSIRVLAISAKIIIYKNGLPSKSIIGEWLGCMLK